MTTSIYSLPIESTLRIARHYFISSDGTFNNSIGWGANGIEYNGNGAKLTPEQQKRVKEYPEKFGCYNIYSNNCEMFAWYIMTGRRYSGQTQVNSHTQIGASVISLVQPVLTVRGMKYVQLEQAIVRKLNEDLEAAFKSKLEAEQAMRDEFWEKRDAGLI
ncbi:NC domain-containing protein [Coleofasciculus sp. G2-EDA-02]|uniref:NC domain-containing protein n=1 Tax=Coleofasciculus sp. G2-EDA-02 TaxID=3069529 RepID=UPI0032F2F766